MCFASSCWEQLCRLLMLGDFVGSDSLLLSKQLYCRFCFVNKKDFLSTKITCELISSNSANTSEFVSYHSCCGTRDDSSEHKSPCSVLK